MPSQNSTITHDLVKRVQNFCTRLNKKGRVLGLPEAAAAMLEADKNLLIEKSGKVFLACACRTKATEKRTALINTLWLSVERIVTGLQNNPQWTNIDARSLNVQYKKDWMHALTIYKFSQSQRYSPHKWQMIVDWVNNFCNVVTGMHHLGDIPLGPISKLQAICEELADAVEEARLAIEHWAQCMNDRQVAGEAIIPVIFDVFAQLGKLPKWTKEDILVLGFCNWHVTSSRNSCNLTAMHALHTGGPTLLQEILSHADGRTPILRSGYKPVATIQTVRHGARIKIQKETVTGWIVFSRLAGEKDFTLLGYTRYHFFSDFRPVTGTQEELREYRLQGFEKNDAVGQFSDVLFARVLPPDSVIPDSKPAIRVREVGQTVRVETVKLPGYSMNVYTRTDADTAFTFLGHAPKRGCLIDTRPLKRPYTAECRYYYLVLVKDGEETGLHSDIHQVIFHAQQPDLFQYKPTATFTRARDGVIISFRKNAPWNIAMNIYTRMQQETAFTLLAHAAKEDLKAYNLSYKDTRIRLEGDTRGREYKLRGVANGHEIGHESDVYTVLMVG